MADKTINELTAATSVQNADLFVLEQSGTAKKLTGQILLTWLVNQADGHGGIQSITWVDSGTAGDGQLHTATIHYADTATSTFTVRDGYKGNTGAAWYMHIKYASRNPVADADMGNTPDKFIGVYSGTSATAPTAYTAYTWYEWKGAKGDTGDACTITSQTVTYLEGSSGTTVPEGAWSDTIPTVSPGNYLWTRTRVAYIDGTVVISYSVSHNGIDGQGAVSTVNNVSPSGSGNVSLAASDIPCSDNDSVQTHITAVESNLSSVQGQEVRHISDTITSLPKSYGYAWITANHRVINCEFGTPSVVQGDVTWTTSSGDVTFTGTISGSTTIDFDIVKTVSP